MLMAKALRRDYLKISLRVLLGNLFALQKSKFFFKNKKYKSWCGKLVGF
jgi:hypothetical protein